MTIADLTELRIATDPLVVETHKSSRSSLASRVLVRTFICHKGPSSARQILHASFTMSYSFSTSDFGLTVDDDMDMGLAFSNMHDTIRSLRDKPKPRKEHADLKGDLFKAFKGISAPGTFAAWEALPTTPPAGLHVESVGQITLPLDDGQIRRLIQKSHQAPYGRRSETLVDLSVRNTWEINGDQLLFLNPSWQAYLLDLSKTVASRLGINAPIRVELYKMLIYERGAMFKPHTE
jgi:hypothetical protein